MPITSIDKIISDWLNSGFYTENEILECLGFILFTILCLGLTILFTGFIGWERERNGHDAGLRTHILIAIGSALIMFLSIYGFQSWNAEGYSNQDPARLAAGVVSGIGFLGAGAIVQNGITVRGLTTATTIWVSMAIGLACGSGNFVTALLATVVSLVSLGAMKKLEKKASRKNPLLIIVIPHDQAVMKEVIETAERYGISLHDTYNELLTYQQNEAIRIVIRLSASNNSVIASFTDELRLLLHPLELKVTTES